MTTGLFRTSTAQGIGARRAQRIRRASSINDTLDSFADRLALHGNVDRAAREIGKSPAYGRVLLQRLRARLGEQAR